MSPCIPQVLKLFQSRVRIVRDPWHAVEEVGLQKTGLINHSMEVDYGLGCGV
jgi:hypothetical protein